MSVGTKRKLSFATRAAQLSTRLNAGRGSGGGGMYKYFRPKKQVTSKIRFYSGKYESPLDGSDDDFYTYLQHRIWTDSKKMQFACTRRPGDQAPEPPFPCVACNLMEHGNNTITLSEQRVFNLLWLSDFHEVEEPSKKNPEKMVKYKDPCPGRGCERCINNEAKVFGDRRWFAVGKNHFNNIIEVNRLVGEHCNCGGTIKLIAFECLNCAEMLLDVENSKKTDEQLAQYAVSTVTCRKCRQANVPMEVVECDKCQDPARLQIFDTEVEVKKTGEGTGTTLMFPKWGHQAMPIPEKLKAMAEPWEFDKVFAPDSPEIMAKRLGVANPFLGSQRKAPAGESASVDYGAKPEGAAEDYSGEGEGTEE
jgi:hypothetical protein